MLQVKGVWATSVLEFRAFAIVMGTWRTLTRAELLRPRHDDKNWVMRLARMDTAATRIKHSTKTKPVHLQNFTNAHVAKRV